MRTSTGSASIFATFDEIQSLLVGATVNPGIDDKVASLRSGVAGLITVLSFPALR